MDRHSNIHIDVLERDDAVVVVVEGELDLCAAPEFERSLVTVGGRDTSAIVVDLDRVSFMDSAAVHILLHFSSSQSYRERLTLSTGSPQVRRLLELTGVKRYLSFVDRR
jgi:anti-sigma B factor antagonist